MIIIIIVIMNKNILKRNKKLVTMSNYRNIHYNSKLTSTNLFSLKNLLFVHKNKNKHFLMNT